VGAFKKRWVIMVRVLFCVITENFVMFLFKVSACVSLVRAAREREQGRQRWR
jgi:hypothetical protein